MVATTTETITMLIKHSSSMHHDKTKVPMATKGSVKYAASTVTVQGDALNFSSQASTVTQHHIITRPHQFHGTLAQTWQP